MDIAMEDWVKRIEALEAVESIRRLKATYARLCDGGYPSDAIAALFTQDGIWEGKGRGPFRGREAIAEYFNGMDRTFTWSKHCLVLPDIRIAEDGQSATGTWDTLTPTTITRDGEATANWIAGFYEDDYRKEDGVWKISHTRWHFEIFCSHADGWVPDPLVNLPTP